MTATYFQVTIDFRSPGQRYNSGLGTSGADIESAQEEMRKGMAYYLGLGYLITAAYIAEVCNTCNGCGKVFVPQKRNPRLGKNKRCPDCRGKAERRVETWVSIPHKYQKGLSEVEAIV